MTIDASGRFCPFMSRPFVAGETGPSLVPCMVECACWCQLHDWKKCDKLGKPEKIPNTGYCGMMPPGE